MWINRIPSDGSGLSSFDEVYQNEGRRNTDFKVEFAKAPDCFRYSNRDQKMCVTIHHRVYPETCETLFSLAIPLATVRIQWRFRITSNTFYHAFSWPQDQMNFCDQCNEHSWCLAQYCSKHRYLAKKWPSDAAVSEACDRKHPETQHLGDDLDYLIIARLGQRGYDFHHGSYTSGA